MAAGISSAQPCFLLRHDMGQVKDCFLVLEKKVLCEVKVAKVVPLLFASFFVFNTCYPSGCHNLYNFLECVFLNRPVVGRKPIVSSLLSELHCTK